MKCGVLRIKRTCNPMWFEIIGLIQQKVTKWCKINKDLH